MTQFHLPIPPIRLNTHELQQCLALAGEAALGFLKPESKTTADELDRMMGKVKGKWIYSHQFIEAAEKLSLKTEYYADSEMTPWLRGPEGVRAALPSEDAEATIEYTDWPSCISTLRSAVERGKVHRRRISNDDLRQAISQRKVPILNICQRRLRGDRGPYFGHYIVLTGYDDNGLFFHDSGGARGGPYLSQYSGDARMDWLREPAFYDTLIISAA